MRRVLKRIIKLLRTVLLLAILLPALLLVAVVVLLTVGPTVTLDRFAPQLSSAISRAGKREIRATGLTATLAWQPTLSLREASYTRLSNGSTNYAITAPKLRARIDLLPLLDRELDLSQISTPHLEWTRYKHGKPPSSITGRVERASLLRTPKTEAGPGLLRISLTRAAIGYGKRNDKTLAFEQLDFANETAGARLDATGGWLGKPCHVRVDAGPIASWKGTNAVPLKLHIATEGGSLIDVEGSMTRQTGGREFALAVDARGERFADLTPWLGRFVDADLTYDLSATIAIEGRQMAARELVARLGQSDLRGELAWVRGTNAPLIRADLHSELIDINELSQLGGRSTPETVADPPPPPPQQAPSADVSETPPPEARTNLPRHRLEVPIWPDRLPVPDASVALSADRMRLGEHEVSDLVLAATCRDGSLLPSHVRYDYAGAHLEGHVALALAGDTPEAMLTVTASHVDVGQLLQARGIATNLAFRAEQLGIDASARGHTLAEILDWADIRASLTNGVFTYQPPGSNLTVTVAVDHAMAHGSEDETITFRAEGTVNDEPVTVELGSAWLPSSKGVRRVPLHLAISTSTESLELNGNTLLPFRRDANQLTFSFKAEDLAALSPPGGPSLPSMGPLHIGADLRATPRGFELTNGVVAIGSSSITGFGHLDTLGDRPFLGVRIESGGIQLDDLALKEWTRPRSGTADVARAEAPDGAAATPSDDKPKPTREDTALRAILRDLDATLSLEVHEVLSGDDRLGAGRIQLTLDRGHLVVAPFRIELPGGIIEASLDYEEGANHESMDLRAKIDRFDYGVLARRLSTNETTSGLLDLDLHVTGSAPTLATILDDADGYLAVAVRPDDLNADVFNLWSANLITALVPSLDKRPTSTLNCIAAAFILRDGVLTDRVIALDTSRVRIIGQGRVSFAGNELHVKLTPKSKRPEFFSLATPVGVKGSMDDPEIDISIWGVTKSVFSFLTSIVHVPVRRLFTTPQPADGTEALLEEMERAIVRLIEESEGDE